MIRSTRFAALVAAAALGFAFSTPASAALTDNGLSLNALTENALTDNALTENALTENALTENALTENALTENALTENARDTHGSRAATAHRAPAGLVAITLPSGMTLSR